MAEDLEEETEILEDVEETEDVQVESFVRPFVFTHSTRELATRRNIAHPPAG